MAQEPSPIPRTVEEFRRNFGEIRGLCSTCNHLPDCLHRLVDGTVIWFCEEFDDSPVPEESGSKPEETGAENGEYMGLCAHCGLRDICEHHEKKMGGIWSCEWYID